MDERDQLTELHKDEIRNKIAPTILIAGASRFI